MRRSAKDDAPFNALMEIEVGKMAANHVEEYGERRDGAGGPKRRPTKPKVVDFVEKS